MNISPNNHSPNPALDRVCVVLVEDSDDDAYFFRRILRHSGESCDYHHFQDGRGVIDFLAKEAELAAGHGACRVYLLFLDLKMPVLNGFDVLTWIKQNPVPQPLVVCVLSGSDDQKDRKRTQEMGANEYLVKPISVSILQQRIRAMREIGSGGLSPASLPEGSGIKP